jgi:hypothetical protein
MLICEDCLKRNAWVPSGIKNVADCDWCWERNVLTHEYREPVIPRNEKSPFVDMLDLIQQAAYHDCERFEICFVNGHPKAGQVDTAASRELLQLLAVRGDRKDWLGIDWVATRKRFEQAKHSYQQIEERRIAEIMSTRRISV